MKYFLSLIYGVAVIVLCVCTVIKGVRYDYLATAIVGVICTVVSVITLISGIYEYIKVRRQNKK